jgi:hypothetical protein
MRPGPNPVKGAGCGRQPGARKAAPSTACEASGVYVGRPKNCSDESEGLLQGGNGTRTAARRRFPAISHTLVRPPNPEPYQGSPDAAASGFQRCKKEWPMHQDHLPVENFCPNHKREPARNQGIFSRPPDLETWRPRRLRVWTPGAPALRAAGCRGSNNFRPVAIFPDFTVQSRKISILSRRP